MLARPRFLVLVLVILVGAPAAAAAADRSVPSSTTRSVAATSPRLPPPLLTGFTEGLGRGLDGLSHLPDVAAEIAEAWRAGLAGLAGGEMAARIVGGLAGGGIAALLLWLVARRAARHRLDAPAVDFAGRLKGAGWRLVTDACALATFGLVGYLALVRLIPEAASFPRLVGFATLAAATGFGGYLAAGRFLLAPGDGERRLMPMPHASRHMRALLAYGILGPAFTQSIVVVRAATPDPLGLPGWMLLGATVLTVYKVAWFWLGRHDIAALVAAGGGSTTDDPETRDREGGAAFLRRAGAIALPWSYIAVAIAIWAIAQVAAASGTESDLQLAAVAGLTQTLVVILPIGAAGVTALARSLGKRVLAGRRDPVAVALAATASTVSTGLVWVASLALMVRLWSGVLVDPVSADAVSALRLLTRAGAAIVTGWAAWTFARAYFDAQAPAPRAVFGVEDEDGHHPIATRLATVLPIVRNLVLGAVLAVTGLVVLAALGLEITPFLAGFGVIGLAISFGSQALVRDIVSGIFFMADDAFRIGEYIDTGRLKGTVEKITIRSVQLRHQNGQVHTIPFGQLQAITNFSRDWTTVKFLLRLDRDTDPELARKAIKRVGAAMADDPELGPELIGPLKMQGIQDITDTALVVRCKFTCKPFKPTTLQREALKRIHRAFGEAGLLFASPPVQLRETAAGVSRPTLAAASSGTAEPLPTAAE